MTQQHVALALLMAILTVLMPLDRAVQAQFFPVPDFSGNSSTFLNQSSHGVVSHCIRLDGRCVIEVAANKSNISNRVREIQPRLNEIARYYFQSESTSVKVYEQKAEQLLDIYVAVGDRDVRLLSVTNQDAGLRGTSIEQRADEMQREIRNGLTQAKQEREASFLMAQAREVAIVLVLVILATIVLFYLERKVRQQRDAFHDSLDTSSEEAISTKITQSQRQQITEIKYRGLQITRFGLWALATLHLVGLFPHTRFLQIWIFNFFRIPFDVFLVGLTLYFVIRFSFILIDKFTSALANNNLLTPAANLRLQLRISTILSLTKGIVAVAWIIVGILIGLSIIGINIAPLLAGAGLIGVAISLASQNLIRDAINGFFIILEDQYAVGDFVGIGEASGSVEAMNLRITQLRDTEGRLITIPNSEIRTVTNYTNNWSQVDLKIPIAYDADIEKALTIIEDIGESMMRDHAWRKDILERPILLGVDEFSNMGVIMRVWIKTKPLEKWPISREYRRRLKLAFDEAGINLALPHQQIWFSHYQDSWGE